MSSDEIIIPHIASLPEGKIEVITTHANADFDALASMVAVSKLYPKALMVFPGSQEQNLRNFFLQSTLYLFSFAKLKEVDFNKVGRLILVDTRQAGRIGQFKDLLKNKNLSVHIYDHHPATEDDLHGEVEVVSLVGACATIMIEILKAKGLSLTPDEATLLALGIHEDTGSLTFVSATPRDYRAAAYLLEQGANLNTVSEMITREMSSEQVALLNEMIQALTKSNVNGVDVAQVQVQTDHYVGDFAVLVHKLMDIKNIPVLFALAQMEDRIYLVGRSRVREVDVAAVLRPLGGGGHASAASASIKDQTLSQVSDRLLASLGQKVQPLRRARDIMAFPVISIPPDGTLQQARELFTRYDINVILVLEENGPVLGFISRQNVAKALFHGLVDLPVSEFMTTEVDTVGPLATFAEILHHIVERKLRVLPVVDKDRTLGVITRTDLLNILASETDVAGQAGANGDETPHGRLKNIESLMRERLPRRIIDLLIELGQTADRLGFAAYAVGGFIRDLFTRQDNLDIDVVIEGDGIQFARVFVREHPAVRARYHRKFNTAVLIFPDGFKVDVVTSRLEYYESPAALPVVQAGSLRMDLYRRDFSINTLAVHLNEPNFGLLVDYFRGVTDIKNGFIRVLHNLSFVEDPTRVFRAIRFEQRFGFKIDKLTTNLIHNAVRHNFFQKLSGNRLFGELKLILEEEDPAPAIHRMAEFDLLKFISPDLKITRSKTDLFKRIKQVRDWFDLTYFGENYQAWMLYFLGLIDGLHLDSLRRVSRRLMLPRQMHQRLIEGKPGIDRTLRALYRPENQTPGRIYNLLHSLPTEPILFLMAKTTRESTRRAVSSYFTKLKDVRTELSGTDLIALGFTPGPSFKVMLDDLLQARLNGEVCSLEEEKEYIRRRYLPLSETKPPKGKNA